MMKKAQKMQDNIQQAQEEIKQLAATGNAIYQSFSKLHATITITL
jgi:DNA-binding protein YbaB